MLARSIAGTQVEQREAEAAGHHRVDAKLAAKACPVDGGGAVQVAQAKVVPGGEVIGKPRLAVGEAEDEGRLVTEVDPVEDVLQVALAESR